MANFRYCIIAVLLVISTAVNAQFKDVKSYIYLPYSYNFCVQNRDISISATQNRDISVSIPENWGFKVPSFEDNSSGFCASYKFVHYTMYMDTINKYHSIFFVTPEGEAPCLELRLAAFGSEQTEESIQSNFGNFYRTSQIEDKEIEAYQYISDSYVITFRILTKDEQEKQACKDIIASATSCYEATAEMFSSVNSGLRNNPISYFANDSTYYPEMGFMFVNPYDMSADIKAQDFVINESETRLDAFVTLDELVEEDYAGYFWEKNFNMRYTFIKRVEGEEKLKDEIEARINLNAYNETCRRQFFYPVDGLAATVHVLGSAYQPMIAVVIPAKDYEALFVFENISSKELTDIETILSLMRIDEKQKEGMKTLSSISQSLQELVQIQPFEKREYEAIKPGNKVSTKDMELIVCRIPEAKAEITIPALSAVITHPGYKEMPLNEKKKQYDVILSTKKSSPYDPDTVYTGIITYSNSYNDQVIMWVADNEEGFTAEEYFRQQYIGFECKPEYEQIKRLGQLKIKSRTWYVLTINDEDFWMDFYITENNGKIIEMRVIRTTENDAIVNKIETLLQKATFK